METYFNDVSIESSEVYYNVNEPLCPVNKSEVSDVGSYFELYFEGIGLTSISLFGILGNILSVIVLSRKSMRSSVCFFLLALSISDLLFLSISMLLFGIPKILKYFPLATYDEFYTFMCPYLFPLGYSFQTCTVYLTAGVTIERFIAVCRPLQARHLCTWKRAQVFTFVIIAISFVYNFPKWFELQSISKSMNESDTMCIKKEITYTNLRNNENYKFYYINLSYLIFVYLIPFFVILMLNYFIVKSVRLSNQMRSRMTTSVKADDSFSITLFGVVALFLICNLLGCVLNIIESFTSEQGNIFEIFVRVSNFLITLNSSANCILYTIYAKRFREELFRLQNDIIEKLNCFHLSKPRKFSSTQSVSLPIS